MYRAPLTYIILFFLTFTVSYSVYSVSSVFAQTEQQINEQKAQKQAQLQGILSEIATIASSQSSISTKLSGLRSQKNQLEALVVAMNNDLKLLEEETRKQEDELVVLANKYSLQQALYSVESQRSTFETFLSADDFSQVMDRLLYFNVQEKLFSQQREYIETKKVAIESNKKLIAEQQKIIQDSLSSVNKQIADLENEQLKLAQQQAARYSQRNALVSDISNLDRAAQAIVNSKASTVTNPGSGVGTGTGGTQPVPTPIVQPNPTGAISVFVGGNYFTRTDSVLRVSSAGNDLVLQGIWTTNFAGTIEFNKNTGIFAINELSLDQYLYGLAEMPSSWPTEALKVQAIAGRSYALYRMQNGGRGGFDLYDSTQDQEYVGLSKIYGAAGSNWKAAVDATSNQVLAVNGSTVQAFYSAENGGHSLSSQESPSFGGYRTYLSAVPDKYNDGGVWKSYGMGTSSYCRDDAIINPAFWCKQTTVNTMALMQDYVNGAIYYDIYKTVKAPSTQSAAALEASLGEKSIQNQVGTIQTVTQQYDQGGNVLVENSKYTASIQVVGDKGTVTVSGTGFKTSYNVRSPGNNSLWSSLYDIRKVSDNNWEMWSRGWGHRVGMSQFGAYGRAQAGQSASAILTYYYQGSNIVQYNAGRNVRIALTKVGSRVMRVTSQTELSLYEGGTLIKKIPAGTELRIEYN